MTSRKVYFPQLDALRGIAFLCVFFFHAITTGPPTGNGINDFLIYIHTQLWLGVEIFFVLSSFLLTLLGLTEYDQTGKFSIVNFFTRRILRIWPLYYCFILGAYIFLKPVIEKGHLGVGFPDIKYYLFFVSNFYKPDHVFFLRLLWTVSVEEQFYILLGIALKYFHKKLNYFFLFLAVTGFLFSLVRILKEQGLYFQTLNYFFAFAVGGIAAGIYFKYKHRITTFFCALNNRSLILVYLYLPVHFLIFFLIDPEGNNRYFSLASRYLFVGYIAFFILQQLSLPNGEIKIGKNKALLFTGKISFGLYVFHGIVISGCKWLEQKGMIHSWMIFPIALVISYAVASISYYGFERFFLRLKNKVRIT